MSNGIVDCSNGELADMLEKDHVFADLIQYIRGSGLAVGSLDANNIIKLFNYYIDDWSYTDLADTSPEEFVKYITYRLFLDTIIVSFRDGMQKLQASGKTLSWQGPKVFGTDYPSGKAEIKDIYLVPVSSYSTRAAGIQLNLYPDSYCTLPIDLYFDINAMGRSVIKNHLTEPVEDLPIYIGSHLYFRDVKIKDFTLDWFKKYVSGK